MRPPPWVLAALAYSAYDRLLGLSPLDWEGRLEETSEPLQPDRAAALDFPIEQVVGSYKHPAYGSLTIRACGERLVMQFRSLRVTLAYQGERRFLSLEEIVDSAPQISVQFSTPDPGESLNLLVSLNFEDGGDPVEVFTRRLSAVPDRTCADRVR